MLSSIVNAQSEYTAKTVVDSPFSCEDIGREPSASQQCSRSLATVYTPFVSQPFEPFSCFLIIHLPALFLHLSLLCNLDQSLLCTVTNISAAADEQLGPGFE